MPEFGWEPVILTVHEKYYEESLDWNLVKLLPVSLKIYKSNSFPVTKPRIIGDIGLRAFFHLYKKAKEVIRLEKIDFIYIPIPFFYVSLLGILLKRSTGVSYGIDYIDPWVHRFPGSEKVFSRHWFSTKIAKILEPIAVKKASLITGVAEGYYKGVQERNPHLLKQAVFGDMPYGGEKSDHEKLRQFKTQPYLFKKDAQKIQLIYAGAMLPNAYGPLKSILKSISENKSVFKSVEFHFIGTGKTPQDANGYNVKDLAEEYDLWQTIVFEYPQRISYLDVLVHLQAADGVFILGSTEPHYTPSKVYQAVLSSKPIFAVLHKESTAVKVLQQSHSGMVLSFNGETDILSIENSFTPLIINFFEWIKSFDAGKVDMEIFERYSARNVTKKLAALLDECMNTA